jgi:predicted Zn-dependent peptidase
MRDRQVFEERVLKNGIKVYSYNMDVPFAEARIIVPFGHMHNTGSIIPGSFHFLEHLVTERSTLQSQRGEFEQWLGVRGGRFTAATSLDRTKYAIAAPASISTEAWKFFFAKIFDAVITEEDVQHHRKVVQSERKRKERWYPGTNEIGHYLYTEWLCDDSLPLRRRLGADNDLQAMTAEYLISIYQYYFTPNITVIIGGSIDLDMVCRDLETLATNEVILPTTYGHVEWKNREYHEKAFDDVSRYELYISNFYPTPNFKTRWAISTVCTALVNHITGPLYKWIRDDNGWAYEVRCSRDGDRFVSDWTLFVPLPSLNEVHQVRAEWYDRARAAIADPKFIETEISRQESEFVYDYQTLYQILDAAESTIHYESRVISEKEEREILHSFKDPGYLLTIFDTYYNPTMYGECCTMPLGQRSEQQQIGQQLIQENKAPAEDNSTISTIE